ncbi:MAG: hypothetical protein M3R04_07225, partial [bacterium]|nr:hypothetical protein [bacterium]
MVFDGSGATGGGGGVTSITAGVNELVEKVVPPALVANTRSDKDFPIWAEVTMKLELVAPE